MSRGNRNLAAKFERAKKERKEYAVAASARDDARPAHAAAVCPIIAEHVGMKPRPITQEERDKLVADYMSHRPVHRAPVTVHKRPAHIQALIDANARPPVPRMRKHV